MKILKLKKERKFCATYGAEIDAKTEICPKWGVRVAKKTSIGQEKKVLHLRQLYHSSFRWNWSNI